MDNKNVFVKLDRLITGDMNAATKILVMHMVLTGEVEAPLMKIGRAAGLDGVEIDHARIGGRVSGALSWRSPMILLRDPDLIQLAQDIQSAKQPVAVVEPAPAAKPASRLRQKPPIDLARQPRSTSPGE